MHSVFGCLNAAHSCETQNSSPVRQKSLQTSHTLGPEGVFENVEGSGSQTKLNFSGVILLSIRVELEESLR